MVFLSFLLWLTSFLPWIIFFLQVMKQWSIVYFNNSSLIKLREECPYSEVFYTLFSRIRTEYGEILRITPYSARMWKNADQKIPEYGYILRSLIYDWNLICQDSDHVLFHFLSIFKNASFKGETWERLTIK